MGASGSSFQECVLNCVEWRDEDGADVLVFSDSGHPVSEEMIPRPEVPQLHVSLPLTESAIGFRIWPGAVRLGKYILENPDIFKNKKIIELGGGVGLSGMVAARFASNVLITDRAYFRDPVETALRLNYLTSAEFAPFDWGDAEHLKRVSLMTPFDVVIAADVIYAEEQEPLVNALTAVPVHEETLFVLAYTNRSAEDDEYLKDRLLRDLFRVVERDEGIMVLRKVRID